MAETKPSVLIAIERCGFTSDKKYRNMHGNDISEYNARVDYLFSDDTPSVGIGDGGNEIGMGNLEQEITTRDRSMKTWSPKTPTAASLLPSTSDRLTKDSICLLTASPLRLLWTRFPTGRRLFFSS